MTRKTNILTSTIFQLLVTATTLISQASSTMLGDEEEEIKVIETTVNMDEWDNRIVLKEGFISYMHYKKDQKVSLLVYRVSNFVLQLHKCQLDFPEFGLRQQKAIPEIQFNPVSDIFQPVYIKSKGLTATIQMCS
jgi:hypothetical protein